MLILLIAAFITMTTWATPARAQRITDEELADSSLVVDEALAMSEGEDTLLLGLGQSATIFTATARAMAKPVLIATLPLSRFRYAVRGVSSTGVITYPPLTRSKVLKLKQHFDIYVKPLLNAELDSVTVIDYAQSAASLLSALNYLRAYMDNEGFTGIELKYVAVTTPDEAPYVEQTMAGAPFEGRHVQLSFIGNTIDRLNHRAYEEYSKFGPFDVATDAVGRREPNPKYASLVATIARKAEELAKRQRTLGQIILELGPCKSAFAIGRRLFGWATSFHPAVAPASGATQ